MDEDEDGRTLLLGASVVEHLCGTWTPLEAVMPMTWWKMKQ